MIKVSDLSHKRAKQSDPRLAWFMFHNIYIEYSATKNKEEINADMLLTSMSKPEEAKKLNEELEDSRDNDDKKSTYLAKKYHPF